MNVVFQSMQVGFDKDQDVVFNTTYVTDMPYTMPFLAVEDEVKAWVSYNGFYEGNNEKEKAKGSTKIQEIRYNCNGVTGFWEFTLVTAQEVTVLRI